MGHKQELKKVDERNAIQGRNMYVYLATSGTKKKIKNRLMRRVRRKQKEEVRTIIDEITREI
jgi:2-oxo-4-hydroxy-4-carboxy--5-ureidoimidazoline (OHCU) decarboxylase